MTGEEKGILFNIEPSSFVDGPGIRTTVFFKGCNLRCVWCHNPESQTTRPQLLFYEDKCIDCGKCRKKCPFSLASCELCGKCELYCPARAREVCGKEYTVDAVYAEIAKDKDFFGDTGGVTFSGGECMLQIDFLTALLRKCKENGIHTAVDTAGHVPYASFEKVLPYTDLFLYDIKILDPQKHRRYIGTDNTLILDNLQKLLASDARLWIRIPIIPGVNDSVDEMRQIKAFLAYYGTPKRIELLPYHTMGENKYAALNRNVVRFLPPSKEKMDELNAVFN